MRDRFRAYLTTIVRHDGDFRSAALQGGLAGIGKAVLLVTPPVALAPGNAEGSADAVFSAAAIAALWLERVIFSIAVMLRRSIPWWPPGLVSVANYLRCTSGPGSAMSPGERQLTLIPGSAASMSPSGIARDETDRDRQQALRQSSFPPAGGLTRGRVSTRDGCGQTRTRARDDEVQLR